LDTYPGTPWNRGDFILWHGCKEDDSVCWETQVGRGRPAWNIQDAAIVTKHLGFTVDVAAGGIDNLVRHHDYVIAVAESVSGREFAKYWLHGAHLYVDGKKMSKSKGNVHYPTDLIEKGFRKDHVRFFLIYGHYRKKLNFTYKKLAETSRRLDAFKRMVKDLENAEAAHSSEKAKKLTDSIVLSFELNMDNDLDVKAAFNKLYESLSKLHKLLVQRKLSAKDAKAAIDGLHRIDSVLQVIF
jgi:cysteinyl-tRNA synthetase